MNAIAVIAAGALLAAVPGGAFAAESCRAHITVTRTSDHGPGTLRQAIADVCRGGSIDFDLLLPATIHLGTGYLNVNKAMTISGPGPALTVSSNGDRAFRVSGIGVHLHALRVADSFGLFDGGGILNSGDLEIANCVIEHNSIETPGVGQGGGIYNSGKLVVLRTTIKDNLISTQDFIDGGLGGGIYNSGTLYLDSSTVSGNSARSDAADISGLANGGGHTTVVNSTFSDNESAGAAHDNGVVANYAGTLEIIYSTIAGNQMTGHTIFNAAGATLTLHASIVADNPGSGNCDTTPITSLGFNIVDDLSCNLHGRADREGLDPLLLPLDDYDGPTQTHAPGPESPALDAGEAFECPQLDQRGRPRPQGTGCDIGAVEVDPVFLRMSTTADQQEVAPGALVHYAIAVENIGFATTASAVISDELPAGTSFVGPVTLTPPQPDAILAQDASDLPTLASHVTVASGASAMLDLPVSIDPGVPLSTVITNTVSVVSDEDPTPVFSAADVQICAGELVVTSTADAGTGSLRDAVAGACNGGRISFAIATPAQIVFASGPINLERSITIQGPGMHKLALRGTHSRLFTVSAATVSLSDMT